MSVIYLRTQIEGQDYGLPLIVGPFNIGEPEDWLRKRGFERSCGLSGNRWECSESKTIKSDINSCCSVTVTHIALITRMQTP